MLHFLQASVLASLHTLLSFTALKLPDVTIEICCKLDHCNDPTKNTGKWQGEGTMTKTDGILLGVRKSGAGMTYQNYTASQTVAISIALGPRP